MHFEEAVVGDTQTQKVLVLSSENWAHPGDDPPPPLSATEISTSALECLGLQCETK